MFRFLIKYFTISLIIIFLISFFPNITTTARFTLVSIVKNIFPDERIKPLVDNTKLEEPRETINTNSFENGIENRMKQFSYLLSEGYAIIHPNICVMPMSNGAK